MAVFNQNQNPFETSFENMTGQAQGAAKKVQQTAGDTVKAVVGDVKEQITGAVVKAGVRKEQESVRVEEHEKKRNEQLLAQTRQNLENINEEMMQAKNKREKTYQERLKAEAQKKQEKKAEEKKKNETPIWQQMLKTGSHEAMKNVAG